MWPGARGDKTVCDSLALGYSSSRFLVDFFFNKTLFYSANTSILVCNKSVSSLSRVSNTHRVHRLKTSRTSCIIVPLLTWLSPSSRRYILINSVPSFKRISKQSRFSFLQVKSRDCSLKIICGDRVYFFYK